MEHLPRNEGADAASTSEISASVLPLISAELRKARAMVWTCPSTRPRSLRHACASSYRPVVPVTPVATVALNPAHPKLLVTEQVYDRHHLPPSLFERNAIALAAQQRRDAEWESGAGGEAAAEARKIALAKLVAAAFKGKAKGGSGDSSGQSALDIVNEFTSGNKVSPETLPHEYKMSTFLCRLLRALLPALQKLRMMATAVQPVVPNPCQRCAFRDVVEMSRTG
jgi:hypothetical protein